MYSHQVWVQVFEYLCTASTVLGFVLAILLSAVPVHVFDCQSTCTWQVLSQIFYMFSLNIWLYLKNLENYHVFTGMFLFLTKRHGMKHKWCKKITAMKMTLCLLLFCTQLHELKHK